jgi:alpha-L-fucosidase
MRGFTPGGAFEKPKALEFGADKAVDGDPKTYWATEDGTTAAMIEIELDPAKPFDRVVLAEPTWLGQRVKKWRISVPAQPSNNHRDWTVLAEGTTIGHKRIVRVPETAAKHLRIEILDARACPCLSGVSVHRSVNIAAQR